MIGTAISGSSGVTMNRVIIDTSVWIEFFNHGDSSWAEQAAYLIERDVVVLTPLIRSEILCGFRSEASFKKATLLLSAYEIVEDTSRSCHDKAVEIYRKCRKKGLTIRNLTDCLIAATALNNNLSICHRDRDFDAVAELFPLQFV